MHGNFDDFLPKIDIEVQGQGAKKTITAVIDTGNNGYLQLPYIEAFPLGLRLDGLQDTSLADGSIVQHLVCRGSVTCDGVTVTSAIDIFPKCHILIGNRLLSLLKRRAIIDVAGNYVELTESSALPTIQLGDPGEVN